MNVKWYYRQSEVPDSVYQHLVQDRHNENGKLGSLEERLLYLYSECEVLTAQKVRTLAEGCEARTLAENNALEGG